MIKTLIVDDSAVVRKLLRRILEEEPDIRVVGEAENSDEAMRGVERLKPDVVTMDIRMPGADGFEATRRIMETCPVPIVIVSASYRPSDVQMSFKALDAGALAALPKPPGIGDARHEQMARDLVRSVRLMSEITVVRRTNNGNVRAQRPVAPVSVPPVAKSRDIQMIAVGASTGGPPALRQLLEQLSPDLRVPIVVVQHISSGFTRGFADWLDQTSSLRVHVATHNEYALPGRCYVAPDGFHLNVENGKRLVFDSSPPDHGLRPSVASLFSSVAREYGARAIGVLLTGMGRDGASELKVMKERGAITICQDEESSVVHGMPGVAIRVGAATHVLALSEIAPFLNKIVGDKKENHDND